MKCPSCGKENPEESRFCSSCGTNLQAGIEVKQIGVKGVGVKPTVTSKIGMSQIRRTVPSPGMCFYHPNVPSKFICAKCGRAICESCMKKRGGMVFCINCIGSLPITGKRPTGVTIIAAYIFIVAVADFIVGLLFLEEGYSYLYYDEFYILMGYAFMIVSGIYIPTGIGLITGRNWARIIYLIFCVLEIFGSFFGPLLGFYFLSLFGFLYICSWIFIVIPIIIIWYLTRPYVKEFFGVT